MTRKKTEEKLEQVPYIQYFVTFKDQIKALLDPGSVDNTISQAFTHSLGLKLWKTNIRAENIDNTTMETYEMVVSIFSVSDKDDRERFFEESFLLADVKPDVVFEMPFLAMNNIDIDFQAQNLK